MALAVNPPSDAASLPLPTARLGWVRAFDTAALPAAERYGIWRDGDVANLSTRYETTPDEPFTAAMDWLDLGTMGIGHAIFTSQHWDRTRSKAARDDNDDLVISVRHAGAAYFDVDGRQVVAPAGSIVLADMRRAHRHFSEASITTGMTLSRAEAERLAPSMRALHGHVIAPQHAALLVSHLAALRGEAGHLPAASGPVLARTIVDLLAVSVAASFAEQPADAQQHERALAVQLRAEIERNLGSPSLTIARLSRTLGVSRSTLYRLVQEEGGVQAYIRTRRLEKVAEVLRRPGERPMLSMLADRWGFCDAAYLGRAFREAYGMTPGEYHTAHAGALIR
jgi:AraC-like DNA-binding protein